MTPSEGKKRGLASSGSEESDKDSDRLIPGAHPHQDASEVEDNRASEAEEELDDFIVEDEGDAQVAALPAMFSMNMHQDLVHQFKVVCQYYVHLAVTKPEARSRRVKRLLSGQCGSFFHSLCKLKSSWFQMTISPCPCLSQGESLRTYEILSHRPYGGPLIRRLS